MDGGEEDCAGRLQLHLRVLRHQQHVATEAVCVEMRECAESVTGLAANSNSSIESEFGLQMLKVEAFVLQKISKRNSRHFCDIEDIGKFQGIHYIVMHMVGRALVVSALYRDRFLSIAGLHENLAERSDKRQLCAERRHSDHRSVGGSSQLRIHPP